MIKKIGIVIQTNHHLTDTGPLCTELKENGFQVILFAYANVKLKPDYNPKLHPEHLDSVEHDKVVWYKNEEDLNEKLVNNEIVAVFTQECIPFFRKPEYFANRKYKIFSIVHSVDNLHLKGIETGSIDKSIVGYEKYGDYLGWDKKDYIALGLPKYDIVQSLDSEIIREKYNLPEKFILLLTPNNNLLSWLVVYKIAKQIRNAGYDVVFKGKKPKCHKPIYHVLSKKYFLSDLSYYPFVTHELIAASQGVVGFDTTAVEEILMCEKPLVNFSIKPYRDKAAREGNFKQFVPMWAAENCLDLNIMDHKKFGMFKKLPKFVHHFEKKGIDYKKIQEEVFSVPGGASKKVVEWLKTQINN